MCIWAQGEAPQHTPSPMSNCEVVHLPSIELELPEVREVLRCVCHTVIFNRALGPLKPKEVDSELFDITWVHCGDAAVEKKVEDKISQLYSWVEKNPGKKAQVCVSFYEKRQKQAWFSKQEERLYWEQWYINITITPQAQQQASAGAAGEQQGTAAASISARAQHKQRVQEALQECITTIVRTVNEKRDHIPPVVSGAAATFPFDITLAGESGSVFGLDVVKRMLLQSTPPSVLH